VRGTNKCRMRRVATALVLFSLVLAPLRAFADSRTDFLIQRLQADDFRVRTNAALALGATNDDAAVQPLCGALADASEVVRQASAVALKRLMRNASLDCLKRRLGAESNDSVRLQISRAMEAIQAGGGGGNGNGGGGGGEVPRTIAGAKYYVALPMVANNNSSRSAADVDRVVRGAAKQKLESLGAYQLAPSNEGPDDARGVLQRRKLKGFYLTLSVDPFDYSGGNLRVVVRLVIFNYPGKAMQGMLNNGVTQQGVRPGDKAAEDNLMQIAVQGALDAFAQRAASM
jgi:HEAT repeats